MRAGKPPIWRILADNIEELTATLLLVVIGVAMIFQVVSRGIFNSPLSWPEMLAQMLLIWASLLGTVGAMKRIEMVRVELLLNALPQGLRRVAELIGLAALILLLVVLGWKGLQLAQRTSTVAHPLPVTWSLGYAAAPAFSALTLFRLAQGYFFTYQFAFVERVYDTDLRSTGPEAGNVPRGATE